MSHAFITGSTRGIGRAIASALVGAGHQVTIAGRNAAGVDAAVAELGAVPGAAGRVAGQVMDVRDTTSVARAVTAAADASGGLDVVVNNAGVGIYGDLETVSDDDWHTVFDTNVTGPFRVMRAAIPLLRQRGGWIINIASLAGANPFAGGGAYCASKAALIALSESAMQELRGADIRVSVVLPGSTATKFSGRSSGGDDSWRLAPEDVAEVVADLLRHPARSLPSRVEIRPSRPKKG